MCVWVPRTTVLRSAMQNACRVIVLLTAGFCPSSTVRAAPLRVRMCACVHVCMCTSKQPASNLDNSAFWPHYPKAVRRPPPLHLMQELSHTRDSAHYCCIHTRLAARSRCASPHYIPTFCDRVFFWFFLILLLGLAWSATVAVRYF